MSHRRFFPTSITCQIAEVHEARTSLSLFCDVRYDRHVRLDRHVATAYYSELTGFAM